MAMQEREGGSCAPVAAVDRDIPYPVQERKEGLPATKTGGKSDEERPSNQDALAAYFDDISKIPLIDAKREVELAKAIEAGKIAEDKLTEEGNLDADMISKLEEQRDAGDNARKELIRANLRLTVSVARVYENRGLSLLDLVQEGNIGLMRAAEKFDYRRGFKFSTYATWWIRQSVSRAVSDYARAIRIPVHMLETMGKIVRTSQDMSFKLGRQPTVEEVSETLGGVSVRKIQECFRLLPHAYSLDSFVNDEADQTIGDTLQDHDVDVAGEAESSVMAESFTNVLRRYLSPKELKVIAERYGLEGGEPKTLGQVGEELGVTRERIRQIEARILRKLRQNGFRSEAREYLECFT